MNEEGPSKTLQAARAAFEDLTLNEGKLVECFAKGQRADFSDDIEDGSLAKIRCEVVRWLLVNAAEAEGTRIRGLHLAHAWIPATDLDLDGISIGFPLTLEGCRLDGALLVRDAQLVTLRLSGTHCHGVEGDRLTAQHGLLLDNGFRTTRKANLRAVEVGDDLNCIRGHFEAGGKNRSALQLDGARIGGRLFLSDARFCPGLQEGTGQPASQKEWHKDAGGVSAQGARIEGNLICLGTEIECSSATAFNASSSSVGGDGAFERLAVNKDVRLRQTQFGGTVSWGGSSIGGALHLTRATIGGDLIMDSTPSRREGVGAGRTTTLGRDLFMSGMGVSGRLDMGEADVSHVKLHVLRRARIGFFDDSRVEWRSDLIVRLEGIALGGIAVDRPPDEEAQERRTEDGSEALNRGKLDEAPEAEAPDTPADPPDAEGFIGEQTGQGQGGAREKGQTATDLRDPGDPRMPSTETWLERRKRWLGPQQNPWSPQPYGQVVAALRLAGEDTLARKIAIDREEQRRRRGGLSMLSQGWNWVLKNVLGHGYEPYRAFVAGAGVILIGWAVFNFLLTPDDFKRDEGAPPMYSLAYSIDVFLPIIDLGLADAWRPRELWVSVFVWAEVGLGWLLTTLGVAGVAGLIRQD